MQHPTAMSGSTVGRCANCDVVLDLDRPTRLFCSDRCQDFVGDVRYFRRCYRDGRWLDEDVRNALNTRMAFLVGDGYDRRARRLTSETRQLVLDQNAGLCRSCNELPATEVDHIDGSSNDTSNLQGLCHDCHTAKTTNSFTPMTPEAKVKRDRFLALVLAD